MGLPACRLTPNFVGEVFQLSGYSYKYVVCGATTCQLWVFINGQWIMNGAIDAPQTNWPIQSCTMPPPTCTAPQVVDPATNTCVTPPPVVCTSPEVRDEATNTCIVQCPSQGLAGFVSNGYEVNFSTWPSVNESYEACLNRCVTTVSRVWGPVLGATGVYYSQTAQQCAVDNYTPLNVQLNPPAPPACTPPQILNADSSACIDPSLNCTAPQVPNAAGTACEDPPPITCIPPQELNASGACWDPLLTCTPPQVLNAAGTACEDPLPGLTCTPPQILNFAGDACISSDTSDPTAPPVLTCIAPAVLNVTGTACIDPAPAPGEPGGGAPTSGTPGYGTPGAESPAAQPGTGATGSGLCGYGQTVVYTSTGTHCVMSNDPCIDNLSCSGDNATATAPGSISTVTGTPTSASTGGGFPNDYARYGEALAAANTINARLDAMNGALTKSVNVGDPLAVDPALMPTFGSTFNNLRAFNLPPHNATCPAPSLDLSAVSMGVHVMNSHCTLVQNHFAALQAAMMVAWSVAALFVVLKA